MKKISIRKLFGNISPVSVTYGADEGDAVFVTASTPLPAAVSPSQAAATSTPLVGTSSTTRTVGPFAPQLGRPLVLTLTGTWAGTVQLLRSTDGGVTKVPVTVAGGPWGVYSANINEPVWSETEAAATFYLSITRTSGTVGYRVAQ